MESKKVLTRFSFFLRKSCHFFLGMSCLLASGQASSGGNQAIASFERAKEILPEVYKRQQTTIYCGCDYDYRKEVLSLGNCERFQYAESNALIQWEHIVPASLFGRNFPEWSSSFPKCKQKGLSGRKCARKYSSEFSHMEADLHNLAPAVDLVNGFRSNYPMREIQKKTDEGVWLCQLYRPEKKRYEVYEQGARGSLYLQNGVVEPQAGVRGRIARAYLYMAWAYPTKMQLSPEEWVLYHKWHETEPPTRSELQQHRRASSLQGNVNPFVAIYENEHRGRGLLVHRPQVELQTKASASMLRQFSSHIFTDVKQVFSRASSKS